MAVSNLPPCSVSPQPNPDLSPDEVETLAKIIRNRNSGFLPSAAEHDVLIEVALRYLRGER